MNNKEYIFYLNWEDKIKNAWKVGYFAKIEEYFYFIISDEKNAQSAYDRGFVGIPGFKPGEIYKSKELFDFMKYRVLNKEANDPYEEFSVNKGKSMVDSFYFEEISENLSKKYMELLLEAYEKQTQLVEFKDKKTNVERNA